MTIDTACSSSLLALENAFHAIRQGHIDAALVGGVNLLLKPNTSVQFMKLGMLSPDGTCKSFDSSGRNKQQKIQEGLHLALNLIGRRGLHSPLLFSFREWILPF